MNHECAEVSNSKRPEGNSLHALTSFGWQSREDRQTDNTPPPDARQSTDRVLFLTITLLVQH